MVIAKLVGSSSLLTVGAIVALATISAHAGRARVPAPPQVARTQIAREVRAKDPRIEEARVKYELRRAETGTHLSPKAEARDAELAKRGSKVREALTGKLDDRRILVLLDGLDGSGKSGTARRVKPIFDGIATVNGIRFGREVTREGTPVHGALARQVMDDINLSLRSKLQPVLSAEETKLLRPYVELAMPQSGEALISDRSWIGRVAYDPYHGDASMREVARRYQLFDAMERAMMNNGVQLRKYYLDAPAERVAQTIGKREAVSPERMSDNDYEVHRDRYVIRKLQLMGHHEISSAAKWRRIPMGDRQEGRLKLIDDLRSLAFPPTW